MEEKRKYKKKDNFRRHAKKMAKRNNSRGVQLSQESYNYYITIFDELKTVTGESKELLCTNFLNELLEGGQTRDVVCHSVVSHILDLVLPHCDAKSVLKVAEVLIEDVRRMCLDSCASHVMQTLLNLALKFSQANAGKEEHEVTEEERLSFVSFLHKVGRYIYNNLDEFVQDTYASHVFCTLLEACSGVQVKEWIKASGKKFINNNFSHDTSKILRIPDEVQTLFHDIIERMFKLPNLKDLIKDNSSCVSLQTTLLVLRFSNHSRCSDFWDHLMQQGILVLSKEDHEYEESSNIPAVFTINAAQRLLEIMMLSATKKEQNQMYTNLFQGRMLSLVKHQSAYFSVQKLLTNWTDKDNFHDVFVEAQGTLPLAYELGRFTVLHALSQACLNLTASQATCLKIVMQLFGCLETPALQLLIVPCLLFGLHSDEYKKMSASGPKKISLPGSLLLQNFLKFTKPVKLIGSMFALEMADLLRMCCDPCGSHVIDAFCESSYVGQKSKDKLTDQLKGNFVHLACDKFGQRCLEAIWNVVHGGMRKSICVELASEELKVKENKYGAFLWHKFNMRLFKTLKNKQDWMDAVETEVKMKRDLNNLLANVTEDEPKKKKIKKEEADEPHGEDDFGGKAIKEEAMEDEDPNNPSEGTPIPKKKKKKDKKSDELGQKTPSPKKIKIKQEEEEELQGENGFVGMAIKEEYPNNPSEGTPTPKKKKKKDKKSDELGQKTPSPKKIKIKQEEEEELQGENGFGRMEIKEEYPNNPSEGTPTPKKKKKKDKKSDELGQKTPTPQKIKKIKTEEAEELQGENGFGGMAIKEEYPNNPSEGTPTRKKKKKKDKKSDELGQKTPTLKKKKKKSS